VILGNIERAVSSGKHVEIVTNVMPGVNDVIWKPLPTSLNL